MRRVIRWALVAPLVLTAGMGQGAPSPLAPISPALAPSCEGQAARYENGKGFSLFAIRAGEVRVNNPLRPLTPDFTHVLEVIVGGKRATAYGPDFASLRRGGAPGTKQTSLLGAPIQWAPSLPPLPDSLGIVAEDGTALATLAFRACEPPPALAPEPVPKTAKKAPSPARNSDRSKAAKPATASEAKAQSKPPAKTPQGFTMPSGAIGE